MELILAACSTHVREDTSMDVPFIEILCERKLVYSESIILETPIAFPIRPQFAAGCKGSIIVYVSLLLAAHFTYTLWYF